MNPLDQEPSGLETFFDTNTYWRQSNAKPLWLQLNDEQKEAIQLSTGSDFETVFELDSQGNAYKPSTRRHTWEVGNTPIPKAKMKNYCWQEVGEGWIWATNQMKQTRRTPHAKHDDMISSSLSIVSDWDAVDSMIRPFIWQCFRKGITTSMSCSGHWPSTSDLNNRFDKELLVSLETIRQQLGLNGTPTLTEPDKDLLLLPNRNTCLDTSIETGRELDKSSKIEIMTEGDRSNWIETVKREEHLGYVEVYLPVIQYCCSGPDGRHPLQSFADAASVLPYAKVILHKKVEKIRRPQHHTEDGYWMAMTEAYGGPCKRPKHPYLNHNQREEEWHGYYWCEIMVEAPRPKRQRATWNALAAMLDVATYNSITKEKNDLTLGRAFSNYRRKAGNSNRTNEHLKSNIRRNFSGIDSKWAYRFLPEIIQEHNKASLSPPNSL